MVGAVAPLDRLAPQDVYRQLDWIRDEWGDDELVMAKKIVRLRRTLEHLPSRFYERTTQPMEVLCRARIVNGVDWQGALQELGRIVSEWDRGRPPVLDCEVCGISIRGHQAMRNHLYAVHGMDDLAEPLSD